MISLDYMHSENIWFSWSKPSNYQEKLRCHACDERTDRRTESGKSRSVLVDQKPQKYKDHPKLREVSKARALLSSEPGLIKSVVDGRTPLLAAVHYHHHEHEVVLTCSLPSSWGARGCTNLFTTIIIGGKRSIFATIIIIITLIFEHEPKRELKIKYDQN